jgi:putative MATE family efflux protein
MRRRLLSWLGIGTAGDSEPEAVARRRVVAMAWPAVIEGILQTAIGVVDTFFVARVSDEALAGAGTALQLIFIAIVVMSAISVGASVLVAQAVGAGDLPASRSLARQSLMLAIVVSVPLTVGGVAFASHAIAPFGLEPEVETIAVDFWRISALTISSMIGMFVASAVLRGAGDTKTPMRATLLANVVNGVLAYALIFGHFGLPELEAVGSAWAGALGRYTGLALMVLVMLRPRSPISLRGRAGWWPRRRTTRSIFGIGVPAALEELSFSISFAVLTGIVAILGTEALASQRIAFNVMSLGFLPAWGISMAATALVGQSVGARDARSGRLAMHIAAQYAAVWMSVIGVIFFILAEPIARAYTDDPGVIRSSTDAIRALATSQPFWGLMMVYAGALRGTGDSRFPLYANSVFTWATVGACWVVVTQLDRGLGAAWMTFTLIAPLLLIVFRWRLRNDPHLGQRAPSLSEHRSVSAEHAESVPGS